MKSRNLYKEEYYEFSNISKTRGIIMGIATIWIAFFHSPNLHIEKLFKIEILENIIIFIRDLGNVGVDIFLFLSGIGLYYSFSAKNNIKQFYKKRAIRILPSIMIVAILTTAINSGEGIKNFFDRILLISLFTKGDVDFWYFSLIIFLYTIYPFLHKSIQKYDWKATAFFIILILITNHIMLIFNKELFQKIEIATTRIPVFIMGIYIGMKAKNQRKINKAWLVPITILFIGIIGLLYYKVFNKYFILVRYLYCPLAISIVIILSQILKTGKNIAINILTWIGTYSMEIYLLYEYLVKKCDNIFKYTDIYNISYHLAVFILTIILSIALKELSKKIISQVREINAQ